MKTIGNIIWVIFGGLEWAIVLLCAGIVCCCTVVLIPVGIQQFKMAGFVLWPFGKTVVVDKPNGIFKKLVNVIWCILFGWELALCYLIFGLIFCITIIGIPFGKQYFKLAKFILLPIGKKFEKQPKE